ncbi:reverse transcriptase domain-containing protein [Tanacetum coccineum]
MLVTKSVVERKQYIPDKGSEANSEVFLRLDLTETIIVMLGRIWDVSAVTGRYLSTDFVVSDAKGNMIHFYAKATVAHNFLRLKEGSNYSVKIFTVKPNKEEYRILKNDAYMLEFDGSTTIRKALVKADGFVRYLFQLQDFDSIESSDNKYLIYVVGYVTNVGRTNHLKSGSKNLDFHLANHSTSSIVIYDDDAIPAIKALKKANSVVDQQTSGTSVDLSQPQAGTLKNLLMWARNRKNDSITFHCKVTIDGIRTRKGWNFPSCGSNTFDYLVLRYRLEVDVSDDTAHVVVVMFNETATALVKCSADSLMDTVDESSEDHLSLPPALSNLIGTAHVMEIKSHTYYEYGTFESFTCWQILPSEGIEDSVGSSNLDDYPDNQPQKLKRIVRDPSIVTPSKPVEERKNPRMDVEDSESEDSGDSANGTGKKGAVEPSAKKRKNRTVYDETDSA